YNADFDGDQMAVHVPLSTAAQAEARLLMLSANNLLLPADGKPIVAPSHDIVLGLYYLTQSDEHVGGVDEVPAFMSVNDALIAYQHGHFKLQDWVRLPIDREVTSDKELSEAASAPEDLVLTTIGRLIFNEMIRETMADQFEPEDYPLPYFNFVVDRGATSAMISEAYQRGGQHFTAMLADNLKDLGFEYATISGLTIAASDIVIPKDKFAILGAADKEASQIWSKRKKGIITEIEKDIEVTRIWDQATKDLTKAMRSNFDKFNSVYMMAESGARGKIDQVRQLAAMRGLLVGPSGRVLDFPIKANFREGLSVFEYFISTHGGRKGLVDTALKTADSGYLTRRLVDVTLDVSITELDCGTDEFIHIDLSAADSLRKVRKSLLGRTSAEDIIDDSGEVIVGKNEEITNRAVNRIFKLGKPSVTVRSVLTCRTLGGVCAKCYGWDLADGSMAEVGDPVGVVAAQSIGEPGTQLTMRTFHTGGIKGRDITQGLPYVEQLFEVRGVKSSSVLAEADGHVVEVMEMVYDLVTIQSKDGQREKVYEVVHPYNSRLRIHYRSNVAKGDALDLDESVLVEFDGIVTQLFTDTHRTYWRIKVKEEDGMEREYETPRENLAPRVAVGDTVKRGDQ
ncbi:MAG TPA: DNA-directed RNA polymerase subunit beta', partial [Firmicutes bacterium]|nr:DNA-directed RNA polymerase subunit beta' [Bacillota bacterium]